MIHGAVRYVAAGMLWGVLAAAPALPGRAEDASGFEGARVVCLPAPAAGAAPQAGDVLVLLDGEAFPSLAALRKRIADGMGRALRTVARRDGKNVEFLWTPAPGVHRLEAWPDVAELYRRRHGEGEADPAVRDAVGGLRACLEGRARASSRLIAAATAAGVRDPILDWAEGWLLVRHLGAPVEAEGRLRAALGVVELASDPAGRRLRGLCRLALGFRLDAAGRTGDAVRACRDARADGADTGELARRLAATLTAGGRAPHPDAEALLVAAFEDDPLDGELAVLLARVAGSEDRRRVFAARARKLSGAGGGDPRLALQEIVARLEEDAGAAAELDGFFASHPGMPAAERTEAWDAAAAAAERRGAGAEAVSRRARAFAAAPTLDRARALAEQARRVRHYAPVLAALRALYESRTLRHDVIVEYMRTYASLAAEAFVDGGVPVVDEAIRLRRRGREAEAVEFLLERAESLALPDLRVTAGLFVREAGGDAPADTYFNGEYRYWRDGVDEPWWAQYYQMCQFVARTGFPEKFGPDHAEMAMQWVGPPEHATVRSAWAALLWRAERKDEAKAELQRAADALTHPENARYWQPFYAEKRLCRTPRDYVEALNAAWGGGITLPNR